MRKIGIIALDYRAAAEIATTIGLTRGSRAWYYVRDYHDLRGRRHQDAVELFDPEYDVLVEENVWNLRTDWEDLRAQMDATGLVYVTPPSLMPPIPPF